MPVMERKSAKGFTLLELIITVAIAGILLGIGVPGFGSLMRESRISSQYNSLVGSLYQARSEAIKGASDVTVCPKRGSGDNRCGGNNDWENGWIVFLDRTNAPGEVNADISAGDEIISVKPEIKGNNTITAIGSSTNAVGNVSNGKLRQIFTEWGHVAIHWINHYLRRHAWSCRFQSIKYCSNG